MQKRIIKCLGIVLLFVIAALLVWNLTDSATIVEGLDVKDLSFSDSWKLRMALTPKELHLFSGAGCPFYIDYSIRMGGLTYCLSQDGCDTIYVPELNLYYSVTDENHKKLHVFLSD